MAETVPGANWMRWGWVDGVVETAVSVAIGIGVELAVGEAGGGVKTAVGEAVVGTGLLVGVVSTSVPQADDSNKRKQTVRGRNCFSNIIHSYANTSLALEVYGKRETAVSQLCYHFIRCSKIPFMNKSFINETSVAEYIAKTFPGVETTTNFGYTFFFYGSDHRLPFATLASSDNEYDRISNLDRPGVFRLNLGVSKQIFQSLFGTTKVDVSSYDFTALDVIMPHPDYAKQHFICVLSPGEAVFEKICVLLAEAYGIAVQRYTRQHKDE